MRLDRGANYYQKDRNIQLKLKKYHSIDLCVRFSIDALDCVCVVNRNAYNTAERTSLTQRLNAEKHTEFGIVLVRCYFVWFHLVLSWIFWSFWYLFALRIICKNPNLRKSSIRETYSTFAMNGIYVLFYSCRINDSSLYPKLISILRTISVSKKNHANTILPSKILAVTNKKFNSDIGDSWMRSLSILIKDKTHNITDAIAAIHENIKLIRTYRAMISFSSLALH